MNTPACQSTLSIAAATCRRSGGAWSLVCVGAVSLLAASVVGCDSSPDTSRPLVLFVSGDTDGRIVPCGCASGQSGGLPRRAAFLKELRGGAEVIVLDVGGAAERTSEYDRLRFEAIVRGEMLMGLAAHNLGSSEVKLGPDYLRRITSELSLPLVSANTTDSDGHAIAEPHVSIHAGGREILVVGVLGQTYQTDSVRVSPPGRAVLTALEGLGGTYDHLIVLAYMDEDELFRLASTLPEADAVVGGPTLQPLVPRHIGPTLVTSATNKGKFVARLTCGPANSRPDWSAEIVELTDRYPDDSQQLANLDWFYGQLKQRDFAASETSFGPGLWSEDASPEVAGSPSCRECHEADYEIWERSAHSHAWQSLADKRTEVDPQCQRCHTTGYGMHGGFLSAGSTPERRDVGCEDCHGASSAHAKDPLKKTSRFETASDSCLACHDQENSPTFDYATFWDKIRHGEADDHPAASPAKPSPDRGDES